MRFINFSVVKFAFFLTAGILVAHIYPSSTYFYLFLFIIISLIINWIITRNHLFQTPYFGIITYASFFFLGAILYQIQLPEFNNNHYSHLERVTSQDETLQLKIKEVLKNDIYNTKYIVEVIAINKKPTDGKLLLNIKRDSVEHFFEIDDELLVSSKYNKILPPLNPYQFDYSGYMKSLGVYYQLEINQCDILTFLKGKSTFRGQADKIRNHIIQKLNHISFSKDELAIVQALILGQRKDINKQLYSEYSAAGAIHILAVSGLHIGIIYMILFFILNPLKNLFKSKIIVSILIVIILWGFAFLTGLSPSVIRAVTMFSFLAFAKSMNRETNSINTLFLSYFVLLIINPLWLFHVGFQLSYLAVFFILWLLPLFNRIYYPKNKILKKIWGIITVTLAAQIGIIPLSLYYFHQFPGLFFITNLVILPFLGILLGGGIILIVLVVLNFIPDWYISSYNYLIKMLNSFIKWIAHQESFLYQEITFSINKVLASYILIISLILILRRQNRINTLFLIVGLTLVFSVTVFDNYSNSSNELIVFHKSKHSIIGNKNGFDFQLLKSDSTKSYFDSNPIKGYKIEKGIKKYSESPIPSVFKYKSNIILVLDSLGIYPKNHKIDIVILSNSPKINLMRLIDSLQPRKVIADGNNYKTYVNRWKNTCEEKQMPFHYTGTDGAFVFK